MANGTYYKMVMEIYGYEELLSLSVMEIWGLDYNTGSASII